MRGLLPFPRVSGSVMTMDLPLSDIRVIDLTIARALAFTEKRPPAFTGR